MNERAYDVVTERVLSLLESGVCPWRRPQVDGLPVKALERWDVARPVFEPLAECEKMVAGYASGPKVDHVGSRACYLPILDVVRMPARESFETVPTYYSTLFHELGHSTGHASRLDRKLKNAFGSDDYGREELVAEMTAAFLGDRAGIGSDCVALSASYLDSWIRTIRTDRRAVVVAAGAAQKAANLILGATVAEQREAA